VPDSSVKTVIYLDQNHVSYITKARLGTTLYPAIPEYWRDLYEVLVNAVESNVAVCPVSSFHYSESELNPTLFPEILRTMERLYCGVRVRDFHHVLQMQAVEALSDFLDVAEDARPDLEGPFSGDPNAPVPEHPEPLHLVGSGFFKDLSREIKRYHEAQKEAKPVGNFAQQKRVESSQFLFDAYIRPLLDVAARGLDMFTLAGLDLPVELTRVHRRLLGREPTVKEVVKFLKSPRMAAAAFVDVYSSLRAGMVITGQNRKQKGSDLNDVLIAATVLPYCDVFATDGHIKQLIVALKLDSRYDVRVFGSRKADVVALKSLVRELAP
jgi:hypothetical protein